MSNLEHPLSILAIDDDPADLKLLKMKIANIDGWNDFTFRGFQNWESASSQLESIHVDLIVVDYLLGINTGLDVVKAVRNRDDLRPIIVLTGQGDATLAAEITRAGADDYLCKKDLDSESLRRAISNALAQYKLRCEKEVLTTQLVQAQKMESVGLLAGGIAHDFNNILFPILGHTEMLMEDIPENSPFQESLNEIYTGVLRARDLVQQILTFSRQENSALTVLKIQRIIKEALKLIRSTIPATIDIQQEIQADCGPVKANPTKIHQIIMNLITNSYHAMEDTGGKLKVGLKEVELVEPDLMNPDMEPGVYARLTVTDQGSGMDTAITKKIFDPFFTTKEKGKGTGMGLSVVHGIVKSMNGAIQVHSKPGIGSEFNVYFPLKKNRNVIDGNG